MRLDAVLREQLIEAQKKIVAQIDELIDVQRFSYEDGPPDLRSVYVELQSQLREINEILEADQRDGE